MNLARTCVTCVSKRHRSCLGVKHLSSKFWCLRGADRPCARVEGARVLRRASRRSCSFRAFSALVGLLGYSFLSASVTAKIVNLGTNVAAIIVFGLGGYIWWQVALVMAVFNVVGAVIGARMALRRGSGFVRVVFLVIVAVLIVRLIVG